jgi:hypothetical protein
MMDSKTIRDRSASMVKWLFLLSVVAFVLVTVAFGMTTQAFAKKDDSHDKEHSFYKVASAAASYYDEMHTDEDKISSKYNGHNAPISDAGAFVGFMDEDYNDGIFGGTISKLAAAQQSRGYSSFSDNLGIKHYIQYGHALSAMGLDSVANESLDMAAILRAVGGLIFGMFYTTALVVDILFSVILSVLKIFNPFNLMWQANDNIWAQYFDGGQSATDSRAVSWLAGLRQTVSHLVTVTQDMGLVFAVVAFFIGVGISLILWKKTEGIGSRFRKFATRMLFIIIGIPVLGGLYTVSLNAMADEFSLKNGTPAANQILGSTYVDFETWAKNTHLSLPSGVKLTVDTASSSGGVIDTQNSDSIRVIAKAVNEQNGNILGASKDGSDSMLKYAYSTSDTSKEFDKLKAAYDMLYRYMSSSFYHASDFETEYKTKVMMPDGTYSEEAAKNLTKGMETAGNVKNYEDKKIDMGKGHVDSYTYKGAGNLGFLHDGHREYFGCDDSNDRTSVTFTGAGDSTNYGLSSLSMYNYLTTEFSDSSVITYSANKATSKIVVSSHHSVNLIGDGIAKLLYYTNSLTMLLVITVLGFVYAIGMLINMFGRGIKLITSIPFAMLGSFRAMAKVVTYAVMMIIEVIGTAFIYSIVVDLFVALNNVIETPFQDSVSQNFGATNIMANIMASPAIVSLMLLFGTIVNFFFMAKMLKVRKSAIKTMDEFAASIIDRLFLPDGRSTPGSAIAAKPTNTQRLARAGAAAAGAAGAYVGGKKLMDKFGGPEGVLNSIGHGAGGAADAASAGTALDIANGQAVGGAATGDAVNAAGKAGETTQQCIEGADRQRITDGSDGETQDIKGLPSPDNPSGEQSESERNREALDGPADLRQVDTGDVANKDAKPDDSNKDAKTDAKTDAATKDVKADTSKMDAKDVKAQGAIDSMTGKTSAMEEDANQKEARQKRVEGAKEAVEGAGKAAVGAVEAGAGAYTGDADLVKDGAQRAVKGVKQSSDGAKKAKNAETDVQRKQIARNSQKSVSGQSAPASRNGGSRQGGSVQHVHASAGSHVTNVASKTSSVHNAAPTHVTAAPAPSASSKLTRQDVAKLEANNKALLNARSQVNNGTPVRIGNKIYRNETEIMSTVRKNKSLINQAKASNTRTAASKAKTSDTVVRTVSKLK